MSEQRVVYLSAVSAGRLVAGMNRLLGKAETESIEQFSIIGGNDLWHAIVLVNIRPVMVWEVGEAEEATIEARLEYETAIGVKPR